MTHRADASSTLDPRYGYTGPLIRGLNPATLIDTPLRDRITSSLFWKESCFGLSCSTLLDHAVLLTSLGSTSGPSMRPTPFICLLFKLLTLTPSPAIVLEYLHAGGEEWKYLRALAAMYVRLTFEPVEVYRTLEPLLGDRRKLRRRRREGWTLTFVDEFVDELLTKERVCGVSLWMLPRRGVLEDEGRLGERVSPLQGELDEEEEREGDVGREGGGGDESEDGRSAGGSSGGSDEGSE